MEKSSKKTITIIEIILIIFAVIVTNRIFSFFVSIQFEKLLNTKNIIQTFHSEDPRMLENMRTKYKIEYITLQKNRIVGKTDHSLPMVNPIALETKKNHEVFSTGYTELLKKTRPYISLQFSGLFIAFPLSFPDKTNSYIVFHKVLP